MRSLLQDVLNALLSADADAGAGYGRPSAGRSAQRNGYRHRDLDTRVGTIDVAVPGVQIHRESPGISLRADTEGLRRLRHGTDY